MLQGPLPTILGFSTQECKPKQKERKQNMVFIVLNIVAAIISRGSPPVFLLAVMPTTVKDWN